MNDPRAPLDFGAAMTGFAVVAAANCLYLTGLPLILDPMMSMEPFYIQMAQHSVPSIVSGPPAWGPLYAVWLKPFVALLGDPLAVYTANLYALSIGVSGLVYLYLLLLTRRVAAAVGAALFFLISDFNVPLSSKVSAFALMSVLAGLTISELVGVGARRLCIAAAGVLLASYARPELYPAAVCLCLAATWLAYRELRTSGPRILAWPAASVGSLLVLGCWIGNPLFNADPGDDRFLMAFREHFAWNWSQWHGQGRYFLSIWEEEFGAAHTPLQALVNNPTAVMHHLSDNLFGTLRFIVGAAFDHYPLLAPATRPALVQAESWLVSAIVFGSLILVAARPGLRRALVGRYGHVLVPYTVVAAFAVAAATAIFPLSHYLVIPGVFLVLAATLAATLLVPTSPARYSWRARTLAALACLVAVPRPFVLPSAYVVPGSNFKGRIEVTRTITDTIAFIRSLELPAPVQVLTLTDGIGELLGRGFHEVKMWQKGAQPLDAYIRDNHIDMIVSLEPGRQSFSFDDPYWNLVQTTPDAAGFTRFTIPNHETVHVYVRTERLRR